MEIQFDLDLLSKLERVELLQLILFADKYDLLLKDNHPFKVKFVSLSMDDFQIWVTEINAKYGDKKINLNI